MLIISCLLSDQKCNKKGKNKENNGNAILITENNFVGGTEQNEPEPENPAAQTHEMDSSRKPNSRFS